MARNGRRGRSDRVGPRLTLIYRQLARLLVKVLTCRSSTRPRLQDPKPVMQGAQREGAGVTRVYLIDST
jgi:hypothetical protein